MNRYCPVFEKDENKFIIEHPDWAGNSEEDAKNMGRGTMLVEAILFQFKYTRDIKEVDEQNFPHVKANLTSSTGSLPVCVFDGPMMKEIQEEVKDGR